MKNITFLLLFVVMWDGYRMVPSCDQSMTIKPGEDISGRDFNPDKHCGYTTEKRIMVEKLMAREDVNRLIGVDYWANPKETKRMFSDINLEVFEIK